MNQWRQQIDKKHVGKQGLTSRIFHLYPVRLIVCYGCYELFWFYGRNTNHFCNTLNHDLAIRNTEQFNAMITDNWYIYIYIYIYLYIYAYIYMRIYMRIYIYIYMPRQYFFTAMALLILMLKSIQRSATII